MFLQAKETLVVELSRKKTNIKCTSPLKLNSNSSSNCTQDDSNGRATCASQTPNNSSALPIPIPKTITKTIPKNELILTLRVDVDLAPAIDDVMPPVVSKETQTIDNFFDIQQKNIDHNKDIAQTIADHFIEQQHHLFEQCLEPEIDIEVSLKNMEKLNKRYKFKIIVILYF